MDDNNVVQATVLGAGSPREALKILCSHINRLYARIEQLEAAAVVTDPWESWEDEPAPLAPAAAPEPDGIIVEVIGDEVHIDIPEPTDQQVQQRDLMLKQVLKLDERAKEAGWAEADYAAQFLRYGPYWLYTIDREYVMMLPYETRQHMVADIVVNDPKVAHEVGRDILKFDAQSSNTSNISFPE